MDERRRIAVFSDTHALEEALEAFLQDTEKQVVQAYWFLGDALGYGDRGIAVADRLQKMFAGKPLEDLYAALQGNHDAMALGLLDGKQTDLDTLKYDQIQGEMLRDTKPDVADWLKDLPPQIDVKHDGQSTGIYLAHASYYLPDREVALWKSAWRETNGRRKATNLKKSWESIKDMQGICQPFRLLFVGHTHMPVIYRKKAEDGGIDKKIEMIEPFFDEPQRFEKLSEQPLIVDVGSIALPRSPDGATYVLVDLDPAKPDQVEIQFRRIYFDYEGTIERLQTYAHGSFAMFERVLPNVGKPR